MVIFIQHLKR